MSDYLIHELERYGVAVRDRSEVGELHGDNGQLEAVTLKDGERFPFSFLFSFSARGRAPSGWASLLPARRRLHPHRRSSRRGHLLETSVPGIFAAGDVRCGSTKRCAAAVGEGSMAVQFVHEYLATSTAAVS